MMVEDSTNTKAPTILSSRCSWNRGSHGPRTWQDSADVSTSSWDESRMSRWKTNARAFWANWTLSGCSPRRVRCLHFALSLRRPRGRRRSAAGRRSWEHAALHLHRHLYVKSTFFYETRPHYRAIYIYYLHVGLNLHHVGSRLLQRNNMIIFGQIPLRVQQFPGWTDVWPRHNLESECVSANCNLPTMRVLLQQFHKVVNCSPSTRLRRPYQVLNGPIAASRFTKEGMCSLSVYKVFIASFENYAVYYAILLGHDRKST